MRNSVNVLLKVALPALAMVVPGVAAAPRLADDHTYRKHVLESSRPVSIAAPGHGMHWSALSEM
jgi:hypothetical protein